MLVHDVPVVVKADAVARGEDSECDDLSIAHEDGMLPARGEPGHSGWVKGERVCQLSCALTHPLPTI